MNRQKKCLWKDQIITATERLKEYQMWFPYPCIISYFLALLLIGHVLLGLNPRLGNPAKLVEFSAPASHEGAIWLSVSILDGATVITTADRKVFRWQQNEQNAPEVELFSKYLQKRLNEVVLTAALAKNISKIQSMVVLAVDQKVSISQIRPLIYILAQAGISSYAFETNQPVQKHLG